MEGQEAVIIVEATYGNGDDVVDFGEQVRSLVRNGRLFLTVSNYIFPDPSPGKPKTLKLMYEAPGDNQTHVCMAEENDIILLPEVDTKSVGIFYSNNSVPRIYLDRVLTQLTKVSNIDILTCPWHPIAGNPFPELSWQFHVSTHLTIVLQILKLLHTAQQIKPYEYVFFLEHDVLYPESYFEIEPFSEDVLSNENYIGLNEEGFQGNPPNYQPPLHQLVLRMPVAIEHFTSCVAKALVRGSINVEPYGDLAWVTRRAPDPPVHINHGHHVTSHYRIYPTDDIQPSHPYWGTASDWWE